VILAVALAVRYDGIDWGAPYNYHEDSSGRQLQAFEMASQRSLKPADQLLSPFLAYLLLAEYSAYYLGGRITGAFSSLDDFPRPWQNNSRAFSLTWIARMNSVLFDLANIVVVFLIGQRIGAMPVALLASGFLAVNYLHIRNAHYGYVDLPMILAVLLSVLMALKFNATKRIRYLGFAAFCGGVATAIKQTGGLAAVPVIVAAILSARQERDARQRISRLVLVLGLVGVFLVLGFFSLNPYAFVQLRSVFDGLRTLAEMGKQPWRGQDDLSTPVAFFLTTLQAAGLLMTLLSLAGIVLLLKKEPMTGVIVLCFPVAYVLYMAPQSIFFIRYVMPIMPFVALAAGFASERLLRLLPSGWGRRVAALGLVVAVVVFPLERALTHNRVLRNGDTRNIARRWLTEHIPLDAGIATEVGAPELRGWPRVEPIGWDLIRRSVRELCENGLEYVLTTSHGYGVYEVAPKRLNITPIHHSLAQVGQLVFEMSPASGPYRHRNADNHTPFYDIHVYRYTGPLIRLFRLPPRSDCLRATIAAHRQ